MLPGKVPERWLPFQASGELRSRFPSLAIWLTAIDPKTKKAVDCQGLRVELLDAEGHVYLSEGSCGQCGDHFWRTGQTFPEFPRADRRAHRAGAPFMDLEQVSIFHVPNPHVTRPAHWRGEPVPLRAHLGNFDMILTGLSLRTNGAAYESAQFASYYWEPAFVLEKDGCPAVDWAEPQWTAEDALGSHGRWISAHQKVVRFHATFYPSFKNRTAPVVLTNSPAFRLADGMTNILWNLKTRFETDDLEILGLFPPGPRAFSNGVYQATAPPGFASSQPHTSWSGGSRVPCRSGPGMERLLQ